ncbi:PH domain-containing protein [Actinoplanes sp. G11-F43]|uniref:PH domain-containing protein n=1 Tax=Actinoplanes sp. G11-F43 TaxID=3424130 RepID=UPI003D352FCB
MQWRVRPVLPLVKLIVALTFPALAAIFAEGEWSRWVLALIAAGAVVVWAARDVLVPVRLAADPAGITVVTGFSRRKHIPWSQIERVRVEQSTRRGLRSEFLEIDAGEAVYLFTPNDLSADPETVALALTEVRTG